MAVAPSTLSRRWCPTQTSFSRPMTWQWYSWTGRPSWGRTSPQSLWLAPPQVSNAALGPPADPQSWSGQGLLARMLPRLPDFHWGPAGGAWRATLQQQTRIRPSFEVSKQAGKQLLLLGCARCAAHQVPCRPHLPEFSTATGSTWLVSGWGSTSTNADENGQGGSDPINLQYGEQSYISPAAGCTARMGSCTPLAVCAYGPAAVDSTSPTVPRQASCQGRRARFAGRRAGLTAGLGMWVERGGCAVQQHVQGRLPHTHPPFATPWARTYTLTPHTRTHTQATVGARWHSTLARLLGPSRGVRRTTCWWALCQERPGAGKWACRRPTPMCSTLKTGSRRSWT
jgi:hypothetical protein